MLYDEEMSALNLSDKEKTIVEYLFKGTTGRDLRYEEPLTIHHDDRIWFDPESGTGICPLILVRFLRNIKPQNGFEDNQMFESRYHLEFLPTELHVIAMSIYKEYRKTQPVQWDKEGF